MSSGSSTSGDSMMQDSVPVLEARKLNKWYNRDNPNKETVQALNEVSLEINENEFVTLVGPSGCGKTTTLHVFAGLVPIDEGEALHKNELITGPSTERAVVFQDFNLFPWKTVRENIRFGLKMMGELSKEEMDATTERMVELVNLAGFGDHFPGELSGGMQQRVGLARALAVDPDILLMDEPFGALDAQTRELMQNELLQIWEEDRKTILFVTHDIDETVYLSDRILVMTLNPRTVAKSIPVPFDRPRTPDIKTTAEFNQVKAQVWNTFKEDLTVEGG